MKDNGSALALFIHPCLVTIHPIFNSIYPDIKLSYLIDYQLNNT